MTVAEIWANDWFTIAPKHRTKERLAAHIAEALASVSPPAADEAKHLDDLSVDAFAAAMKAKLKYAREHKGRGG